MREAGFDAFLTKPVKSAQLTRCLQLLLSGGNRAADERKTLVTRHTLAEAERRAAILLVEDNLVNRTLGLKLLQRLGHRVDTANHGREALEALSRARYDMVLMDCQMPEMDGYEATRAIRNGDALVLDRSIPIIAMTAHALEGEREKVLDAGMDDYLAKPIDVRELAETVQRWLDRASVR
jgi:CheY-like chemotaxis protein